MHAKKTEKRIKIIDAIVNTLQSDRIYGKLDYKKQSEQHIKQFMYQPLIETVKKMYMEIDGKTEDSALMLAEKHLLWEGNKKTTVSHMSLFGCNHRPDLVLDIDGMTLAIEIKRGDKGTNLREGIGQGIVYTTKYDFALLLYIDTSDTDRIRKAHNDPKETELVESLWQNHNLRFEVAGED